MKHEGNETTRELIVQQMVHKNVKNGVLNFRRLKGWWYKS